MKNNKTKNPEEIVMNIFIALLSLIVFVVSLAWIKMVSNSWLISIGVNAFILALMALVSTNNNKK